MVFLLGIHMTHPQMSPYQTHLPFHQHRVSSGISLVVQWLGLNGVPNAGGPGVIPGQGIRSHMLQIRVSLSQLKSLRAATKTQHGQINFFFFKASPPSSHPLTHPQNFLLFSFFSKALLTTLSICLLSVLPPLECKLHEARAFLVSFTVVYPLPRTDWHTLRYTSICWTENHGRENAMGRHNYRGSTENWKSCTPGGRHSL